jgi:hypothetical protein
VKIVNAPHGQVPQLVPISEAGAAYRLISERVDALVRRRAGIAEPIGLVAGLCRITLCELP